ncbi:hypothetical protein LCGC14_0483920 [marine sediment metagenome]|uniref:Uncharacterized protein n=1 Tax=marine sediment metagenome TaxID=412755 RepID=A0A0F9UVM6_9ZZZZ
MKSSRLPSIVETVKWIETKHTEKKGKQIADYCGLCGGSWPCASKRMTIEIRRLWKQLKPGDRPK